MIKKILKKISKLFLGFLCIFTTLGFLMLLVRDYSTPIVKAVNASNGGVITKTFDLAGIIIASDSVEIIAQNKMYVKQVCVENTQIVNANAPIIKFDMERTKSDEINNIQLNADGVYVVNNNIYIDYINDKEVIEAGDVIIRYSVHDNSNLQIETQMDEYISDTLNKKYTKVYYYKDYYNERVKTKLSYMNKFSDFNMVYFATDEKSSEKININNNVNVIVEVGLEYNAIIVPVTAIIPISEIKDNTPCYVYCIVEEDTMLGKQSRVVIRDAYIYTVGSSKVAIHIYNDDNVITDFKNLKVVNYATVAIKDGSRVRIK